MYPTCAIEEYASSRLIFVCVIAARVPTRQRQHAHRLHDRHPIESYRPENRQEQPQQQREACCLRSDADITP